ncbi:hypothetical protein BIFGAL_03104 [Bifidobacterium gallicum DSM 20093 = LMG 11596]|uniref:Uncharacterized protein n=1 Tax=Bifidobacterium gallicum DSM 20093 = LMG 11596 TaxID=561180 RepID=D1NTE6_9BIFI|nr:hypothetical protein BIFGAL_03104 [Bifidobacterium gallicum DSM 20093 = LMG 11596]
MSIAHGHTALWPCARSMPYPWPQRFNDSAIQQCNDSMMVHQRGAQCRCTGSS